MQWTAPRRLAAVLPGLALAVAAPMAGGSASAASSPTPALVAAEAAPAVQLVVITYSATVLVPHQKNNLVAQHAGEAGVQAMAAAGEIGSSLQALNDQWAKELASDPGKYNFATKPVRTVRTSTTATCSGWFVTPGGYLVTAAHCVTTDSTITDDLVGNVLPQYIRRSYHETVARWTRQHVPMDQTIHSELRSYETKWFEENSALTHTSIKAVVALGIRGKNGQRSQRALPARIVSQGTPYPGQDFALLKVSGRDNLPTLGLGNQSRLAVGDNLYIDGFPGTVTDSAIFTQQSRLAPTFTDGLLSAFRTTNKNVQYLQTQAPAYHGNSGGPVLDADGNVVGTLIAGAADPNTGQLVPGEQFALPAAVIARELAGQGDPGTSAPPPSAPADTPEADRAGSWPAPE
jgi:S1-C subfamily serine protease